MKLSKFVIILACLVSLLNPLLVFAQDKKTDTAQTTAGSKNFDIGLNYQGVDGSIKDYLCTPSEPADGKDLERCVGRLFRFGITAGALVLVFFVVMAGYLYMFSGESGKTKAKLYLKNSLTGMAVLLSSYLLLNFINPSLVMFKPIQPPIFDAAILPSCEDLGLGSDCVVATSTTGGVGRGDIVAIATAEIGKKGTAMFPKGNFLQASEIINIAYAGNNTGPEIDKYFSPGGTPGQPWCAYFATWVYGQAGIKTIGTLPGRGGTLTLNEYFKNNAGKKIAEGTIKYLSAADVNAGTAKPLPGDLAFYDRGSEGDPKGHTAIVTGYDATQKKMSSIDGNQDQSDEVKKKVRDINKQCTGDTTCKLIGVGRVER